MRVALVDFDGKIPNLALMKICQYYKDQGAEVGFHINNPDLVYVSCLFSRNRDQCYGLKKIYQRIIFGGPGVNDSWLPPEIHQSLPDYDLYPSQYSQGYTTRGCPKSCPWCQVKTEGKYRREDPIKRFHDPRFKEVMVMDNNWLADQDWFYKNTDFLINEGLKVREHGLDFDFLDMEKAQRLKEVKGPKPLKFAFDQPSKKETVKKGLELLKRAGFDIRRDILIYVLAGYNTSHEEDLGRCDLLKKWGATPFVMPYKKNKFIKRLMMWANRPWHFWKTDFKDFVK